MSSPAWTRIEAIDDVDDPRVDDYRDVRDADLRAHDRFLVESRLCVRRLIAGRRFDLRSVLVTRPALAGLHDALGALGPDVPIFVASRELVKRVLGYDLHRGCIASAARPRIETLDSLVTPRTRLLVGLEDVANPENVGNVFRNAVAFGADVVGLSPGCADPLYRKAIRVSMAGSLTVPFGRVDSWPSAMARLRAAGIPTIALATGRDAVEIGDLAGRLGPATALALLLGAEGDGLCAESIAAADVVVRIPMAPGADSLNVATAAGIALHHCFAALGAKSSQR